MEPSQYEGSAAAAGGADGGGSRPASEGGDSSRLGSAGSADGAPPPLMMAGQEAETRIRAAHGAVALRSGVKFVAVELCRERLGG